MTYPGPIRRSKAWAVRDGNASKRSFYIVRRRADGRYSKRGHFWQAMIAEKVLQWWLVISENDSARKSFDFRATAYTEEKAIQYVKEWLTKKGHTQLLREGWTWAAKPFKPPRTAQYEGIVRER
jgi:hypothetical protein